MTKRTKTTAQDAPKAPPPAPHDPAPYAQARDDIRDLLTMPLQAWMLIPPSRRRGDAYTALLTIPLDLASAGYAVTVSQTDSGWCIEACRELQPGRMVRLHGSARSYAACLYRLAESAGDTIARVESRAKRAEPEPEIAA